MAGVGEDDLRNGELVAIGSNSSVCKIMQTESKVSRYESALLVLHSM